MYILVLTFIISKRIIIEKNKLRVPQPAFAMSYFVSCSVSYSSFTYECDLTASSIPLNAQCVAFTSGKLDVTRHLADRIQTCYSSFQGLRTSQVHVQCEVTFLKILNVTCSMINLDNPLYPLVFCILKREDYTLFYIKLLVVGHSCHHFHMCDVLSLWKFPSLSLFVIP